MALNRLLFLSVPLLLVGCYKYAPTTIEEAPVGETVKALLSTEGEIALRDRTGIEEREITGELVDKSGDALVISMKTTSSDRQLGSSSLYQRIDIPKSDVLRVDTRQINQGATAAVIVGSVGGALGLAIILTPSSGIGGGTGGDNPGLEDSVRGWILRVPVAVP